jgi:hypothetical protein
MKVYGEKGMKKSRNRSEKKRLNFLELFYIG